MTTQSKSTNLPDASELPDDLWNRPQNYHPFFSLLSRAVAGAAVGDVGCPPAACGAGCRAPPSDGRFVFYIHISFFVLCPPVEKSTLVTSPHHQFSPFCIEIHEGFKSSRTVCSRLGLGLDLMF